jgi:Leucine-rich repeat (LRR) protein
MDDLGCMKSLLFLLMMFFVVEVSAQHKVFDNLNEAFKQSEKVKSINLARKQISSLPDSFSRFVNLEELVISDNNFNVFPAVVLQCKKLKKLDAAANKFTEIPASLSALQNLEELSFAYNDLKALPKEICLFKNLINFNASNNTITALPECFSSLTKLSILDFSYNNLSVLPDEIIKLPALQTLDLGFNRKLQIQKLEQDAMPALRMFQLKGTSVNDAQMKMMNYAIPDCLLVF